MMKFITKSSSSRIILLIASIGINILWIGYMIQFISSHNNQRTTLDNQFLSSSNFIIEQGPRALHERIQQEERKLRKNKPRVKMDPIIPKPIGKYQSLMKSHILLQDVAKQQYHEKEYGVKRSRWIYNIENEEPYLDKDLPKWQLLNAYGVCEDDECDQYKNEEEKQEEERKPQQYQQVFDNNYDMNKPNSVEPLVRSDENVFRMPFTYMSNDDEDSTIYSNGHCIGDNFRDFQWQYTSCHVNLLCYDMEKQDWVIMDSPYESKMKRTLKKEIKKLQQKENEKKNENEKKKKKKNETTMNITQDLYSYSSDLDIPWSIGVINPQWDPDDWILLKRTFRRVKPQGFYMLPENVVMIPFHSMAGFNPGHLIWDDFMAFYNLVDIFDLWKKDKHFLYIREGIREPEPLWATCEDDGHEDLPKQCRETFPKFFPLMGSYTVLYDKPTMDELFPTNNQESTLICAKQGLTGMGTISDHGMKQHGWWNSDYDWNHNVGRGKQFYQFRSFLLENLGISPTIISRKQDIPLILLSESSSRRSFDFFPFAEYIQETFQDQVEVRLVTFREMSLEEQMSLVAQSSILISVAGGGTFTAMALPRGSSLILYYESDVVDVMGGSHDEDIINPARLDYDVWNNVGYIRTHWLPFHKTSEPVHGPGPVLETLIRQELDIMKRQGY